MTHITYGEAGWERDHMTKRREWWQEQNPLPILMARGVLGQPTALLTDRGGEAVRHLWSWWAAAREGAPLRLHSDLLNAPHGVEVHVVDPLHGALYLLGAAVGGPSHAQEEKKEKKYITSLQPSCSKSEPKTCPGARGSLYWLWKAPPKEACRVCL